ncbi:MAG TPA: CBS domain-containing protein, partial [Chitinophagaceae bacterium]|nr:CBS domain-containing protein [Chitinophagaceae bacterium]
DALGLVEQCVNAVNHYGYDTKIMFSSVRNSEHVRNALNIGAHTITIPLKILKSLTENHFTMVGTQQFLRDTRLMTVKVKDAINDINPVVDADTRLKDAIVKMTGYGFGCVTVTNNGGSLVGVFTDGDLRRLLQSEGEHILDKKMGDISYKSAVSIDANALLNDAVSLFKEKKVDTILVTDEGRPVGMMDIQDLEKN